MVFGSKCGRRSIEFIQVNTFFFSIRHCSGSQTDDDKCSIIPDLESIPLIIVISAILLWFSCSIMSNSLQLHGLQNARLPCSSPSPRACSNSCPLSLWCHPTISFSVIPFSSSLLSFPASESFTMSQKSADSLEKMSQKKSKVKKNLVYQVNVLEHKLQYSKLKSFKNTGTFINLKKFGGQGVPRLFNIDQWYEHSGLSSLRFFCIFTQVPVMCKVSHYVTISKIIGGWGISWVDLCSPLLQTHVETLTPNTVECNYSEVGLLKRCLS